MTEAKDSTGNRIWSLEVFYHIQYQFQNEWQGSFEDYIKKQIYLYSLAYK